MDKNEKEKKATCAYVPPLVEVYAAEPSLLLAGTTVFGGGAGNGEFGNSFGGGAGSGNFGSSFSGGGGGGSTGGSGGGAGNGNLSTVTGAKILGREFSFSDVWGD